MIPSRTMRRLSSFSLLSFFFAASLKSSFVKASSKESNEEGNEECSTQDNSCSTLFSGYDSLLDVPEVWPEERPATCDDDDFWSTEWRRLQIFRSKYQHVEFCQDPRNDDMCLFLDDTLQICASYRPHYHEMMVHYPARFLDSVRRVAFIGGGDSMLLHEVIKYPSLELVIGLELDQQVTRGSFKYFGSQPHWDDERVEWWFGDATKSLMVLPKEYYGSFDLVLVDMSETVMSLPVTGEVDVLQALALLLQPHGVFVQNENNFPEAAAAFHHTLQIHFYDVPVVCSQTLVLASNGVNFLRNELTDHNVDCILNDLLDDIKDFSLLVRDYQRNASNSQWNSGNSSKRDGEGGVQPSVSGVVMIVDAEGVSSELITSTVSKTLEELVHKEGFSVTSSASSELGNKHVSVAFVLQEGYLIAHCIPELMYCGIDIHLWTNLEQQDKLKKAVLKAIGSKSASSFRIVAGGMIGTKTRKEDEKSRGPLSVDVCDVVQEIRREQKVDSSMVNKVLEKSMGLVGSEEVAVAVMCGRMSESCGSIEALENTGKAKVLALRACADLSDGVQYAQDAAARLQACEAEIIKSISTFISTVKKPLDAIVVDSSSPLVMGQLMLHIVEDESRQSIFAEHRLVVSPMKQSWHRVFVDRFRTAIFKGEPLFRAEVMFNTTDGSFGMAYVSSGDEYFVESLVETVAQIEKDLGLIADIQNIRGPETFMYFENFEPSRTYTHRDYNQSSSFEQWKSQRQVSRQSFVQMMLQGAGDPITPESIRSAMEEVLLEVSDEDKAKETIWVSESTSLGSGAVVVALWEGGSFVVLWDGSTHLDANCVMYEDDGKLVVALVDSLRHTFNLEPVLLDEYPRGIGRVVNWANHVTGHFPTWASAFATDSSGRAAS